MHLLLRQLEDYDPSQDSQAPLLLGICGGVGLFVVLLFCTKLWSSLQPTQKLHLEDWMAGAVTILAIAMYTIICLACNSGFGQYSTYVSPASRSTAMRLIFIYQAIWNWSIALVKISIALLLFRIKQTRAWRIFLTSTIAFLVLAATTSTFFQFLQCRPFSIYWDPSVLSKGSVKCISHEAMIGGIVATSATHITTDLLFSFIPITLISETHKLRSKKIFLAIMMGLGLFPASFAILRTATATSIYTSPDVFRATVMPTLWSMLELEIGLIAATIPKLKGFVQQSLVQLGQCFYEEQTEEQMRNRLVQLGYLRPDVNESSDSFSKPPKLDIDVERVRYGPPGRGATNEQNGHVTTVKQPDAAARGAKATKKVQDFDLIRC